MIVKNRLVYMGAVMVQKNPKLVSYNGVNLICSKKAPKAVRSFVDYKNYMIEYNKKEQQRIEILLANFEREKKQDDYECDD